MTDRRFSSVSNSSECSVGTALLTPEQVVRGSSAEYGIVWDLQRDSPGDTQDNIVPHEVFGRHSFAEASRNWKFDFGEGCVGRAYAKHEVLIVEDMLTGDSIFLRKRIANRFGISTVAFVPQSDGSVLEVGFGRKLSDLPQSWWIRNLLESYTGGENNCGLQDIHRMRTPSPASFLDSRSPSLRALARVAIGINKSVAMLPLRSHAPEESNAVTSYRGDYSSSSSESSYEEDSSYEGDSSWEEDPLLLGECADEEDVQVQLNSPEEKWEQQKEEDMKVKEIRERFDWHENMDLNEPFDKSDLRFAEPPKPVVRVDLASLPKSLPRLKRDSKFVVATVPNYDSYQPSYLREIQAVCSEGSVGHPYFCGGACKYMKTAKGCKFGANCNRCHLCLWTRASQREVEQRKKLHSAGSVGHPHFCGGACKYFTRKECKQGTACDRCHLCVWTRSAERALTRRKNRYFDETVGHPRFCDGFCKYSREATEGGVCNHCHMSF